MSKGRKDTPALQQLIDSTVAGLASSIFAAGFSFPLNRIQKEQKFANKQVCMIEVFLKILQSPGGWKNFYKGGDTGILIGPPIYGITTAVVLKIVDLGLEEHLKNKATSGQKPAEVNEIDCSDIDEVAVLAQIVKDAAKATYQFASKKFEEMDEKSVDPLPYSYDFPLSLLSCAARARTTWDKIRGLDPFAQINRMGTIERRKQPYFSKVTNIEEIKEDGSSHALSSEDSFKKIASPASLF